MKSRPRVYLCIQALQVLWPTGWYSLFAWIRPLYCVKLVFQWLKKVEENTRVTEVQIHCKSHPCLFYTLAHLDGIIRVVVARCPHAYPVVDI